MVKNTTANQASKSLAITNSMINELEKLLPGKVDTNVSLKLLSRWKIGGIADVVVTPHNINDLVILRKWIYEKKASSVVIGSTSNLLFSDAGLRVIMIHITSKFSNITITDNIITADAGVWVPVLARKSMQAGLTGLEHTCGIPGTLGGLVCMNGGSQRKGIGDSLLEVKSVSENGDIIVRSKEECEFSYRTSIYQTKNEVIGQASIILEYIEDKAAARREILEILRSRRIKFPQKEPNCGSVFVSNPAMYADYGPPGKVIEEAGLKGARQGNAVVSESHANFIINSGNATALDTIKLIKKIKNIIEDKTGYKMAVEARFVRPNGQIASL